MNALAIPEPLWPKVFHIDPGGRESAGIALGESVSRSGTERVLLREVHLPSGDDYSARGQLEAILSPAFVARVTARARAEKLSVTFFHTHPASDFARFSLRDDRGEKDLREFLERRVPGKPHMSLVVGRRGHSARMLGSPDPCRVEVVGPIMGRWESERDSGGREHTENIVAQTFDRQVRVFGASAQRQLQALRVAIVGLGGTGSLVAQQLAHLGVGRFLLIDHDTIDESNLNRVVGAEALDVARTSKVDVAARMIMRISPSARVEAVKGNAVLQGLAAKIVECDTVFSCADSHGSRFVLNQLAYQFFIPVFDVGVAIAVGEGSISHVFGRTQMLVPGLPCLTCFRTLDPEEIRRDLMSDVERRKDSYVMGDVEPQPAVVSINSTVSSLAITMFLSAFAGVPVATRHQIYDAMRGMVRPIVGNTVRDCVTCSTEGAFGRGDSWPLPGLRE